MDAQKLTAIAVLGITLWLGGCRRIQSSPENSNNNTRPLAQLPATNTQPAGGPAVIGQARFFKGSIGNSSTLQMKLIRDGEQVTGSYYYHKAGGSIQLKGTVDKAGNLSLDEFDNSLKQTGSFKGSWTKDNETGLDNIAGNWSKPGSDKKTAFSLHEEPIALTGGAEVVAKQIKETNKKLNYKIDISYPEIAAPLDDRFNKLNQASKELVSRTVAQFKRERAEAAAEAQTSDPSTLSELTSDLSGDYVIALADDNLVSIYYDIGGYAAGAAHGSSSSYVLNYDVKSGKLLKFADLFKPGANYLPLISAYCITDLKKQSKNHEDSLPDDMIQSGAGPDAGNFKSWTITRKGLSIDFDAYQVGPYAAGPQTVLVPYAALKDLINPAGPLAEFVK
jgi:hypothetical protein